MPEVKTVGPANSWRLVHDGSKVVVLFESGGYTSTIHQLQEFPSKEDALAAIQSQGLQYTPEE